MSAAAQDDGGAEIVVAAGGAKRTKKHLKLMARIRKHIEKHRVRVRHIFVELDDSGDGALSRKEFTVGLRKILQGSEDPLTKEEMRSIYTVIDSDNSNSLDYREFMAELRLTDAKRQASMALQANKTDTKMVNMSKDMEAQNRR